MTVRNPILAGKKWLRLSGSRRRIARVRASGLFDELGYLELYPDVRAAGCDALTHYLDIGWKEGRLPGGRFDVDAYFAANADLDRAKVNPLLHYVEHGKSEGRALYPGAQPQPKKAWGARFAKSRSRRKLARSVFGNKLAEILAQQVQPNLQSELDQSEVELARLVQGNALAGAQPLVSIIMPTWNRADIISESIRSVIEQDYAHWEMFVCDDGSTDNTEDVVSAFADPRIRYLALPKNGAAAARNAGLSRAAGEIIAYLDSDNYWHPYFLMAMVASLQEQPGRSLAYADFIDYEVSKGGRYTVRSCRRPDFNHERLLERNFIDLNTVVHRRELFDLLGGFNEALTRRQDYGLLLKYTWLRDPLHVSCILALYQRNESLEQITQMMRDDMSCVQIIDNAVDSYLSDGLPLLKKADVKKVTILSWDLSRNHFQKPFALAEALSRDYQVQLISFRFFEEVFPPLEGVQPDFETVYIDGSEFPDFSDAMQRALSLIDGDIIYAVKPRLPSLGLALLANAQKGTPIVLEINDLETVVTAPGREDRHREVSISETDLSDPELLNPHSELWSQLMDPLAKQVPVLLTHNKNIDDHFGKRCLYMRNLKDEGVFNPDNYDREKIRERLGFSSSDRVILFGGLLRKHKGIRELVELVERLNDPRYKLLFVGSRVTPDQEVLIQEAGDRITVLPPQDSISMAQINLGTDIVILWLDPDVPASHYQMPYKLTDALAMGAAVIANDISDLGHLGEQGYLRLVEFGDWEGMIKAVQDVFACPEEASKLRAAARRLYQRQFSYPAARASFAFAANRATAHTNSALPVATEFANWFDGLQKRFR